MCVIGGVPPQMSRLSRLMLPLVCIALLLTCACTITPEAAPTAGPSVTVQRLSSTETSTLRATSAPALAARVFLLDPDVPRALVMDPVRGTVVGQQPLEPGSTALAIVASGQQALALDPQESVLLQLNLPAFTVRSVIMLGRGPAALDVDGRSETAVVAERDDGDLAVIDIEASAVRGRVRTGGHPDAVAVALDGSLAVALDRGPARCAW